jgi:ketosteroid isomerase-like protein
MPMHNPQRTRKTSAASFVERLDAGDVDGSLALYEPHAVLALPDGRIATGPDEIRRAYERLVADRRQFEPGTQRPTLHSGDLALTSSRLTDGVVTVEVARRKRMAPGCG